MMLSRLARETHRAERAKTYKNIFTQHTIVFFYGKKEKQRSEVGVCKVKTSRSFDVDDELRAFSFFVSSIISISIEPDNKYRV